MPQLEDFLGPLDDGVWEVSVTKESVTESLGPSWKRSELNVPSPGTLASFRKGRYHVHETENEWKVHLDRYDPEEHPVMHLLDDAPLLLMIGDTFVTLISSMKRDEKADTKKILETQNKEWHLQILAGIFLALIGLDITLDPLAAFTGIIEVLVPVIIIILGLVVLSGRTNPHGKEPFIEGNIFRGLVIIAAGVCSFHIPPELWILVLTAILSLWMFASAILLLKRVGKGRKAVPEGFISRLIIGILSILIVALAYFMPVSVIGIFIFIMGALIILIGIVLLVNGLRLRGIMKDAQAIEE